PLAARCPITLCSTSASQPAAAASSSMPATPAARCSAIRRVATTWRHHGVQRSLSAQRSACGGSCGCSNDTSTMIRCPYIRSPLARGGQLPAALDRRGDRALYLQIADQLREQIVSGKLAPGSRVPSEHSLMAAYGASR